MSAKFHYNKIIATIGESLQKETVLEKVIQYVDIFRINLSHISDENLKRYIESIRKIDNSKTIIIDTKGPEIRIKNKEGLSLKEGSSLKITHIKNKEKSNCDIIIDYENLDNIKKNTIISLDNHKIYLKVTAVEKGILKCKVQTGGDIQRNSMVFFENYEPDIPFFTKEDQRNILLGIENGINMVAIPFVKSAEDIKLIRDFLDNNEGKHIKIISKIETQKALDNVEEIIQNSDGITIERGNLGNAVNLESLSAIQFKLTKLCNKYGKPVSISTQILESMKEESTPTRAEIDEIVFNIMNGVDSFVLSGETAIGNNPVDTIYWLYKIIYHNQTLAGTNFSMKDLFDTENININNYIIYNSYSISKDLTIKAIICPTETGYTPSRLSCLKPGVPIISFTKNPTTYKYLNLLRGTKGFKISESFNYDNFKQIGKEILRSIFKGDLSLDDKILIVHSNMTQNTSGMINGIEIYNFKDL